GGAGPGARRAGAHPSAPGAGGGPDVTSRGRAKQRRREDEAAAAERAATLEDGVEEGGREPRARETASTGAPADDAAAPRRGTRSSPLSGILGDVAIVLGAFVVASAIAAAARAANFGTALGFGQIGFALALAYTLVRRR